MPRFVIHEHYATSHHFDLRLERDGVPKDMPQGTKKNRLAVRVEDHGLPRLDLVDNSPVEGVPGAVKKSIWNRGSYGAEEFGEENVIVRFRGGRLDGRYAIFRAGGKDWLGHKMKRSGEARD